MALFPLVGCKTPILRKKFCCACFDRNTWNEFENYEQNIPIFIISICYKNIKSYVKLWSPPNASNNILYSLRSTYELNLCLWIQFFFNFEFILCPLSLLFSFFIKLRHLEILLLIIIEWISLGFVFLVFDFVQLSIYCAILVGLILVWIISIPFWLMGRAIFLDAKHVYIIFWFVICVRYMRNIFNVDENLAR